MKRFTQIFAIGFLLAGIAGFIPALCPEGKLFGLFAVNGPHNIVHIATGVVALWMSFMGEAWMRNFMRIFGVVYGLVAVMGLFAGDGLVLGLANNMPDVILHFAAAGAALWAGFAGRGATPRGPTMSHA